MHKKYCLINSNGKYLTSYESSELSVEDLKHTIFTIPPKVKDGFIALWKNNSWNIKKETYLDNLNAEYLKKLQSIDVSTLIENIKISNRLIPSRNGNYIAKRDLIKMIDSEYSKVKNIFLNYYKNRKEIPQLYKDYAKEIQLIKEEIRQISTIFTDYQYTEEDNLFDLTEILNLKSDFDIAFASENNT